MYYHAGVKKFKFTPTQQTRGLSRSVAPRAPQRCAPPPSPPLLPPTQRRPARACCPRARPKNTRSSATLRTRGPLRPRTRRGSPSRTPRTCTRPLPRARRRRRRKKVFVFLKGASACAKVVTSVRPRPPWSGGTPQMAACLRNAAKVRGWRHLHRAGNFSAPPNRAGRGLIKQQLVAV